MHGAIEQVAADLTQLALRMAATVTTPAKKGKRHRIRKEAHAHFLLRARAYSANALLRWAAQQARSGASELTRAQALDTVREGVHPASTPRATWRLDALGPLGLAALGANTPWWTCSNACPARP
jgi:hypothetical protein